jgi:hypothetical protein
MQQCEPLAKGFMPIRGLTAEVDLTMNSLPLQIGSGTRSVWVLCNRFSASYSRRKMPGKGRAEYLVKSDAPFCSVSLAVLEKLLPAAGMMEAMHSSLP